MIIYSPNNAQVNTEIRYVDILLFCVFVVLLYCVFKALFNCINNV